MNEGSSFLLLCDSTLDASDRRARGRVHSSFSSVLGDPRASRSPILHMITPGVARLKAQHLPRLVDAGQGLKVAGTLFDRHPGVDGRYELAVGPVHDRIGRGDIERFGRRDIRLQGQENAIGRIPGVDIAPEIELAGVGIGPIARDRSVIKGGGQCRYRGCWRSVK